MPGRKAMSLGALRGVEEPAGALPFPQDSSRLVHIALCPIECLGSSFMSGFLPDLISFWEPY